MSTPAGLVLALVVVPAATGLVLWVGAWLLKLARRDGGA